VSRSNRNPEEQELCREAAISISAADFEQGPQVSAPTVVADASRGYPDFKIEYCIIVNTRCNLQVVVLNADFSKSQKAISYDVALALGNNYHLPPPDQRH